MLAIECQDDRIDKRLATGYLDQRCDSLDDALALIDRSVHDKKPISVGLKGNAAELLPELLKRGVRPDALTDQTSAHDPANGYLPEGWSVAEWQGASARRSRRCRARRECIDGKTCQRDARVSSRRGANV